MSKKILFINSEKCESEWFDIFSGLHHSGINPEFCCQDHSLHTYCRSKNWPCKKSRFYNNFHKSKAKTMLFYLLRPLSAPLDLFRLLIIKYSKKIDTIICFGTEEKMVLTRLAKLLKLKVVWIFSPGFDLDIPKPIRLSLSRISKHALTICFSDSCKKELEEKHKLKNVNKVNIGIKTKQHQEQKNIFDSLASNTSKYNSKKFFTIGTICDLEGDIGHLEKLLHATKNCLRVIPQLQLIIAGDGEGRKNLDWMAKKMDIGNLVWFVGNHRHPQKWLSNFDIFITSTQNPKLKDLQLLLLAAILEKPAIAPIDIGLDEYIDHNKNGILVDTENSEEFADAIIDLQQNIEKRERLAKNFHSSILEGFPLEKSISDLKSLILEKSN